MKKKKSRICLISVAPFSAFHDMTWVMLVVLGKMDMSRMHDFNSQILVICPLL